MRIGDETYDIDGGANRIRRQSIRRTAKLRGHAWQAALFPSGRAFGYIAYPPRDDGKDTYNEGYVFDGDGALIPARVVRRRRGSGRSRPRARTSRACSRPRTAGR